MEPNEIIQWIVIGFSVSFVTGVTVWLITLAIRSLISFISDR